MGSTLVLIGSIGAAIAGLMGQLTTFRDPAADNRVTRRAKWVLVGVAVSAALSLLGRWIADRESAESSLSRQEALLRTLWEQTNRVNPADFSVSVTYRPEGEPKGSVPIILNNNWELALRAVPPTVKPTLRKPSFWGWSSEPALGDDHLSLKANSQVITIRSWSSSDAPSVEQFSRFGDFTGETKGFAYSTDLNGATLELLLRGHTPYLAQQLASVFSTGLDPKEWAASRDKRIRQLFALPDDTGDLALHAVPVAAQATVLFQNRQVAVMSTSLIAAREWDEDVRGLIVGKFPVAHLENAFAAFVPSLEGGSRPRPWIERVGLITAGGLTVLLLITLWRIFSTPNVAVRL
jgi:hypothetical protein